MRPSTRWSGSIDTVACKHARRLRPPLVTASCVISVLAWPFGDLVFGLWRGER